MKKLIVIIIFATTNIYSQGNLKWNEIKAKPTDASKVTSNSYFIEGKNISFFLVELSRDIDPVIIDSDVNYDNLALYTKTELNVQKFAGLDPDGTNNLNGFNKFNIPTSNLKQELIEDIQGKNVRFLKKEIKSNPTLSPFDYLSQNVEEYKKVKDKKNKGYIDDGTLYLFFDDNLNFILGNEASGCLEKSNVKAVEFIVVHHDNKIPVIDFVAYSSETVPIRNTNMGSTFLNSGSDDGKNQSSTFKHTVKRFRLAGNSNTFKISNGKKKIKDNNGNEKEEEIVRTINVNLCSEILVDVGIGIYYSKLIDPENIQLREILDENDMSMSMKTLTADNATGKVKAAISASFYFKKQPLNDTRGLIDPPLTIIPSWNFGLGISDNFIRDYFLGLNLKIGWGFNISGGINVAQVDRILDHEDFIFNQSKYNFSEVKTYKKWERDWYIGITLDARILAAMLLGRKNEAYGVFSSSGGTSNNVQN